MRALRVVGLADDGSIVCEAEPHADGARPERFTLVDDDMLRAAARGELPRLGRSRSELENQMRPREIQARIRAGASVEQVAAAASMDPVKVDRFAYPVLLERSRTAELAQLAHPVRDDGPDVRTLGEVVAATFGQRGHDYTSAGWDSWRGEDGKWVVQLRWSTGRSDNRAHWTFHPGAHGGTVTVLDELATDLIDPAAGKPLRTVRPVTPLAQQALDLDDLPQPVAQPQRQVATGTDVSAGVAAPTRPTAPQPPHRHEPVRHEQPRHEPTRHEPARPEPAAYEQPRHEPAAYEPTRAEQPRRRPELPEFEPPPYEPPVRDTPEPARETAREAVREPEPEATPEPRATPAPAAAAAPAVAEPAAEPVTESPATPAGQPTSRPAAERAADEAPAKANGTTGAAAPARPARRGGRNNRPVVPSWEDVLLGVRSNPNQ